MGDSAFAQRKTNYGAIYTVQVLQLYNVKVLQFTLYFDALTYLKVALIFPSIESVKQNAHREVQKRTLIHLQRLK